MEICDTVVGVGTEDISVADWVAELSQKPKPIAASPAATTTPAHQPPQSCRMRAKEQR
jgi:hypothetical protein